MARRAVFHFLTTAGERHKYLVTLDAATSPGTVAVFGCFAPEGPQHCSGLPVARYSPIQLDGQLGGKREIGDNAEAHITPAGRAG